MTQHRSHHAISSLAALLMLLVFSVALLAVLLGGANVYERLTARDSQSYERRTAVQYLTTKVHQAQSGSAVTVANFGDGDSLVIAETIDGLPFHTQIYCHEGWLMELFTVAGANLTPHDGSKILPAEDFTVRQEGSLLHLTVAEQTFTLHLRGQEVAP